MLDLKDLKVAVISSDGLPLTETPKGGIEKFVIELGKLFPDWDIYAPDDSTINSIRWLKMGKISRIGKINGGTVSNRRIKVEDIGIDVLNQYDIIINNLQLCSSFIKGVLNKTTKPKIITIFHSALEGLGSYIHEDIINEMKRKYPDRCKIISVSSYLDSITDVSDGYLPLTMYDPLDTIDVDLNSVKIDKRKVIYVGRIAWDKNIDTLIKASRVGNYDLYLIGNIENYNNYEEYIRGLIDNSNVKYLGEMPPKELYEFTVDSLCSIIATTYETFWLSGYEAQLLNVPAIATYKNTRSGASDYSVEDKTIKWINTYRRWENAIISSLNSAIEDVKLFNRDNLNIRNSVLNKIGVKTTVSELFKENVIKLFRS